MSDFEMNIARRIPANVRKIILQENFIDIAKNVDVTGTPMEYLFDVYEEFIDTIGEHDNWNCFRCREHILSEWRKIKTSLIKLQNNEQ